MNSTPLYIRKEIHFNTKLNFIEAVPEMMEGVTTRHVEVIFMIIQVLRSLAPALLSSVPTFVENTFSAGPCKMAAPA